MTGFALDRLRAKISEGHQSLPSKPTKDPFDGFVGTPRGPFQKKSTALPAWRQEIETRWPEDYRAAWPELVESYRHVGHPRAAAEYGAYLTFRDDARRFAQKSARAVNS